MQAKFAVIISVIIVLLVGTLGGQLAFVNKN
jgi:hypothetical protein